MSPVVSTACGLISLVLIGWLLVIGQSFIVPILLAIILVYIASASSNGLARRVPFLASWNRTRGIIVLAIFLALIGLFVGFLTNNGQAISAALPAYSENLNQIFADVAENLGLAEVPTVTSLIEVLRERLDFEALARAVLGAISGMGSIVVLAVFYAIFLAADLKDLPRKLLLALGDEGSANNVSLLVMKTNKRVGDYLIAKTTVNLVLAAISFGIMLVLGIEFALLWAVLIGLLNYIPYLGSIIGVMLPVLLSLAQFGSLGSALAAFVGLMGAQMFAAYVLEPRMLGKSVNLSPFIVLVALAFWTPMWGAIGAVLAVPLTAVAMIIMAEVRVLRPFAVLISESGEV